MLSSSGKDKLEGKKENPFVWSSGKKTRKKIISVLPQSESQDQKAENRTSDRRAKQGELCHNSSSLRKEKVKEAKKKKEKGDYDTKEVYKKIADKLMDLFGV